VRPHELRESSHVAPLAGCGTRANQAIVPLSADGQLTVRNAGAAVHYLIDVTGYFK